MLTGTKMMHKFSYEHNIEHNRSKIRVLHPKIIDKIYTIYGNLVSLGKLFEHCSKA